MSIAFFVLSQWLFAVRLPDSNDQSLPCRPTIACTADIVAPGAFEIELGYLVRHLSLPAWQHTTPFLLKLSVVEWAQLQLSSNGMTFQSGAQQARYFDNIQVGAKFHPLQQSKFVPSISFSAAYSFPTANGQLGYVRTNDLELIAYITKDFGWLHVDLNIGVNIFRLERKPLTQGFFALALSGAIGKGFGVLGEGYYFSRAQPLVDRDAGILLGFTYAARSWLVFDVGGDIGLISTVRGFSLFTGMTIVPVDLWDTVAEKMRRTSHNPK